MTKTFSVRLLRICTILLACGGLMLAVISVCGNTVDRTSLTIGLLSAVASNLFNLVSWRMIKG